MRSLSPKIERARPLLGTTVAIRVHGLLEQEAHRAIDDAFADIALIHGLMSFQEPASEISRLNRDACMRPQTVHPATFEVLRRASDIAAASDGCFDISIAAKLVAWGFLPAPDSRHAPDPKADWRDIALAEDCSVRFRRPLWVDVSGIAKGYAVDRAIEIVRSHGASQASINAGGDLRVFGPEAERVALRSDQESASDIPILEIEDAAIASSSSHPERRHCAEGFRGPHVDPRSNSSVSTDRFVTLVAETCLIADALTKPVLILGEESAALLNRFGASAHLYEPGRGWTHLGAAA